MQTVADSRFLAWEQIDLKNGVFQVRAARWLINKPDLTGWLDWTGTAQLETEIEIALDLLNENKAGSWVGFGNTVNGVCHGVAWIKESRLRGGCFFGAAGY